MKNKPPEGHPSIAVLIPCYNEMQTIAKVVNDFRLELPSARIYVYDNNSEDGSIAEAVKSGAMVIKEKRQGKGFVVAAMLNDIIADVYVLVDGDDTYPAQKVHELIAPVMNEETDMMVGERLSSNSSQTFPRLHYLGNKVIRWLINSIFSSDLKDPLSGYRVFNRAVARHCPIVAAGFDVETEMTLQLLYRRFKISELAIDYRERPEGSISKLKTFRDGLLVVYRIFSILQSYKPLTFFGGIGLVLFTAGMLLGVFVVRENIQAQAVSLLPAILSMVFIILSSLSAVIGIQLHRLNYRLLEESVNIQKLFLLVDRMNAGKDPPSGLEE